MAWRERKDMRWPEWLGHKEQYMDRIWNRSQGNMELPFKGTRDSNSWVARGYRWLKFGRISSGLCSAKKAR